MSVCLAPLVCLFVWPHGGGLGWDFGLRGVLNLIATLGWAWDLCSPNLYQVKSPELEGWDSELWLGSWESSGRHKTSREEVSDCMGKVFPVLGLRKVDGNLGWSRARGEGRGR